MLSTCSTFVKCQYCSKNNILGYFSSCSRKKDTSLKFLLEKCLYSHTILAEWHLKLSRTRKHKWAGLDSNQRRPKSADLQSAAIATMRPAHGVAAGNRTRMCRTTICRISHYSIATVTPAGLEPSIPALKGLCPNL